MGPGRRWFSVGLASSIAAAFFAAPAVAATPYEIGYAERTTTATITASAEASPDDVVSLGLLSYAAAPIVLTFFSPTIDPASALLRVSLWDGSTNLGMIWQALGSSGTSGAVAVFRLTPSAGSHTYRIRAFNAGGGTSTIYGGTAGAGNFAPITLRAALANPSIITQADLDAIENSSGVVALDQAGMDRLDLIWWGVWALVGATFVLILAPRWSSVFRVTHGA